MDCSRTRRLLGGDAFGSRCWCLWWRRDYVSNKITLCLVLSYAPLLDNHSRDILMTRAPAVSHRRVEERAKSEKAEQERTFGHTSTSPHTHKQFKGQTTSHNKTEQN